MLSQVSSLSLSPRLRLRIVFVVLAIILAQQFFKHRGELTSAGRGEAQQGSHQPGAFSCDSLQGLDEILVILKTGATESREKVPVHFNTTLRCVPHYLLLSDFEEDIDGHHVYNALDSVNPEIVAKNPDFEYYQRLRDHGRAAFSEQEVAEWSSVKNTQGGKDSPGWKLDKWKFLPMAEKALQTRPEAKWYVFIEHDTYVLWKTLLEWLSHFDASKKYYLGQQMQIGDVIFAYGGAGFVISNSALKAVVEHRRSKLDFYDDFTAHHWAGDCVLGKALLDADVGLFWSWPNLFSEQPGAMDFDNQFAGPNKRLWCYYASTYHHLLPEEVAQLSELEQDWKHENSTLMRHSDVFRNYVLPKLGPELADWDNMSNDGEDSATTFEACHSACENKPECVQFSLAGQTCKTSAIIKLGRKHSSSTAEPVKSGWMMDRVYDYMKRMDSVCKGEDWIAP